MRDKAASPFPEGIPASGKRPGSAGILLFLASFVALYFELVVIRYLSTEVRDFAYLQNLPLIASFLGLGTGMIVAKPMRAAKRFFPFVAAVLFLLIAYAPSLGLTHVAFPGDFLIWGTEGHQMVPSLGTLRYLAIILGMTALVVAFFLALGKSWESTSPGSRRSRVTESTWPGAWRASSPLLSFPFPAFRLSSGS